MEGNVTKFALQKAPKLLTCGKLTFDETDVLHRVERQNFGLHMFVMSQHT